MTAFGPIAAMQEMVAVEGIVLQKSKVAGRRIFRENTQWEVVARFVRPHSHYRGRL
jgi:hypothetical protein